MKPVTDAAVESVADQLCQKNFQLLKLKLN